MMQIAQMTQTAASEPEWKFWVEGVVIPVILPIILLMLTWIIRKISTGDGKFNKLGVVTTRLDIGVKAATKAADELKSQLDRFERRDRDEAIMDAGKFGEMRAEMERRFVRREEFVRLEQNLLQMGMENSRQNQEILSRLKNIGGHGNG